MSSPVLQSVFEIAHLRMLNLRKTFNFKVSSNSTRWSVTAEREREREREREKVICLIQALMCHRFIRFICTPCTGLVRFAKVNTPFPFLHSVCIFVRHYFNFVFVLKNLKTFKSHKKGANSRAGSCTRSAPIPMPNRKSQRVPDVSRQYHGEIRSCVANHRTQVLDI